MITLVEQQVDLEAESIGLGIGRYFDRLNDGGLSDTIPGMWRTKAALPALAAAINVFVETAGARAGRRHTALPFIANVGCEVAAYLTLRYGLDAAQSNARLTDTAFTLASALEEHINLVTMREDGGEEPDVARHMRRLFDKVHEQLKQVNDARHRSKVWAHVLKKYQPSALNWTKEAKLQIGMKLIELLCESTDLTRIYRQTEGRHDTPWYIALTDEAAELLAVDHARTAEHYPVHQPMIVPPCDWTSVTRGGYLTNSGTKPAEDPETGKLRPLRRRLVLPHSLFQREELPHFDLRHVFDAVNNVQRTPWAINKALLTAVEQSLDVGDKYKSLLSAAPEPEPLRPAGIPTKGDLTVDQRENLQLWKAAQAEWYKADAARKSNNQSNLKKIGVARKFAKYAEIYFPHCVDFRGRIYPLASHLNPQGDDLARGLLQFANGKALGARGAYWLKVHIANLFGVDKVSFEERIAWVDKNTEALLRCAADPFSTDFWTKADGPWQALAACFEFAGYMVQGNDYVSNIPIAMDGSCSGIQHYSAMLRDAEGGAQVNLLPAEKPADIYTAVAQRAQVLIDASPSGDAAHWRGGKVVRKVAKRPTMTYCYGSTRFGMAGQIKHTVEKELGGRGYLNGEDVNVKQASVFMAGVVREAIGEVVKAAKEAMDFLQATALVVAKTGLGIRWTAPNGFPVFQDYKEIVAERVIVYLKGLRIDPVITRQGDRLDADKQALGVAPNFVHSMDAAHLMATVNLGTENGLHDWACIHDSFGVHAADVDTLHAVLREAFIEQYTPDVLAQFRAEIVERLEATHPELIAELPELPPKGDLDLSAIRDSRYCFA